MSPVSLAARIRRLRRARGPVREQQWRRNAIRHGRRLRHISVGFVGAAVLFATELRVGERLLVVGLLLLNNAVATAVEKFGERREGLPVEAITAASGLAAIFATATLLPQARMLAILASVILVAYYASVGGRLVAFGASAVSAVAFLTVGPLLEGADGERLHLVTYLTYVLVLFSLAFFLDTLTSERLRTAAGLERLHEGLRAFGADPDLDTTLRSISDAAGFAVGADDLAILLRDGDHLVMATPSVHADAWSPDQVEEYTRRELAFGDRSPLATAFNTGEMIVVRRVVDDPRFPDWGETLGRTLSALGYRTVTGVPLRVGDDTLGVIYAAFYSRRALGQGGARLLRAFAEQASMAIMRAQAYEQERRLAQRLAEADRLKSEFLGLVSHELRTPLTATKGFVDTVLLQWDRLPDEQRRDLLQRASRRAEELNRLITQLLDYTRIEGDWAPLDPRQVSLRDATERVCADLSGGLDGYDVAIDVPDGLCAVVDPDALTHVLTNVVANAAKYATSGTCISIRAAEEDGEVAVSVTDEGPGIALDEQERVFERFYQSPAHDGPRRGAGLGLAIARRYVEAHGGRIWVESEPGHGATFVFTLTRAAAEAGAGEWFDRRAATLDN